MSFHTCQFSKLILYQLRTHCYKVFFAILLREACLNNVEFVPDPCFMHAQSILKTSRLGQVDFVKIQPFLPFNRARNL